VAWELVEDDAGAPVAKLAKKAAAPVSVRSPGRWQLVEEAPAVDGRPAVQQFKDIRAQRQGAEVARAQMLAPPGPRMVTDEEAGVAAPPINAPIPTRIPVPSGVRSALDIPATSGELLPSPSSPAGRPVNWTNNPNEGDPLAQMVLTGAVLGPLGAAVRPVLTEIGAPLLGGAAPAAARLATAAGEGAAGSASMGGSPREGALLGAFAGGLPAAAQAGELRPAAAALTRPLQPGAAARNAGRRVANVTGESASKAAKNFARKAGGEEGEVLDAVVQRHPELDKAMLKADLHPESALEHVKATKRTVNANLDADYTRAQEHYADQPVDAQASIPQILDDYDALLRQNTAKLDRYDVLSRARDEVTRLGDRLREAQGLPPADGDYSGTVISPRDLRDLKGTIGNRAFKMGEAVTDKAKVNAELYTPISQQMDRIMKNTPGVDFAEFKLNNRDDSVLIDTEKTLAERAAKEATGHENVIDRIKHVAHHTVLPLAAGAGLHFGGHAGHAIGATAGAALAFQGIKRLGRAADFHLAKLAQSQAISGAAPLSDIFEAIHNGVPAAVALPFAQERAR
jgi:hypothetical protein